MVNNPDKADVLGAIGNTPLIRLNGPSAASGCEILGKAEFMNPAGSVKDRAALAIVQDAETSGRLRPGGTVVEGTAGNTGIGLALVGNARGYRTVIVMPETQSQEKQDLLRLMGVDLRLVKAVPYRDPGNYVHVAERLAHDLDQTGGRVDAFTCAVGTGGTLAGVGRALKGRNPSIRIVLSDPMGSALYGFYANGALKAVGSSITEGIGQGRITDNLAGAEIDWAEQIPDAEAVSALFELLQTDGLLLGGSAGINVAGALRVARRLGPGHTIVTILCDGGQRYQSKLFNPMFLRDKGLPVPAWLQ